MTLGSQKQFTIITNSQNMGLQLDCAQHGLSDSQPCLACRLTVCRLCAFEVEGGVVCSSACALALLQKQGKSVKKGSRRGLGRVYRLYMISVFIAVLLLVGFMLSRWLELMGKVP